MIDKVLSRFKIKTKVVLFVLPFVVSISAVGLTGLYASGMLQSRMEISNNVLQSLTGFKELYASLDAFLKDTTEANRDKVHADLADQAAVLAVTRGQIGAGGVGAGTLDEAVQHVNVVDGIVQKLWTLKSQQNDTTAAIDKGTTEIEDAKKASEDCVKAGKPEVNVSVLPGTSKIVLALQSNRADVAMIDTSAGAYISQQHKGEFEVPDASYAPRPYGLVLPKGSEELAKAMQAAVQALIDEGTYGKILAKWGQEVGAVKEVTINEGAGL